MRGDEVQAAPLLAAAALWAGAAREAEIVAGQVAAKARVVEMAERAVASGANRSAAALAKAALLAV